MDTIVNQQAKVAFEAMLKALQEIKRDPKAKKLASKTRESVDEALCAAE